MRIAIDAAQAAKDKKTGIEYFSFKLINNILKFDKKNSYTVLSNKPIKFSSNNYKLIYKDKSRLWNKFYLPLLLLKGKYDIFLEPGNSLPSYAPKNSFTFIHDLGFRHFPKTYSINNRLLQESALKNAVKRAKGLFFLTDHAKADFRVFYPNFRRRMEVVGLGIDEHRFNKHSSSRPIKDKYILYIGRIEKKKNISNLIKSFAILKKDRSFNYKLVLGGKPGYGYKDIKKIIDKHKLSNDILLTGYIKDKDLPAYYYFADLFIFPTLYEGFGIPILEAFASNTPVACSKSSSLPEVAGKGAEYFNPENPKEIVRVIKKIIKSTQLRKKLIAEGTKQLSRYSWQKSAKIVINTFNSLDEK